MSVKFGARYNLLGKGPLVVRGVVESDCKAGNTRTGLPRKRCRDRAGIQSAAEQYSNRHVADAAQSHCIVERFSIPNNRIIWQIFPPSLRSFCQVPPPPNLYFPVAPD